MRRLALIERGGSIYRDKQECLDHLYHLSKNRIPLHGIEVVKLSRYQAETNLYKTIWFEDQTDVYERAATFIKEQMVGLWNYAELKFG